jgi:hypothetical protein
MTETLLDFSSEISDYEYVTQNKIVNLVDSLNVKHIFMKEINQNFLQDFIVLFPKKTFFFTVTLYGGGSSGFKPSYTSNIANGGYSSGCIVRFPIEIKNDSGSYFAKVRIGKGGGGFDISEKILGNNGEYSNFDLVQSNETIDKPYRKEKGRSNTTMTEGLSSYGSGMLLDGSIIEGTSTNTYFSFKGSNSQNTFVQGAGGEHRNFYAPYTSPHNGYNSFTGIGGDYLGDIDGEENTGAGGAGYYRSVVDISLNRPTRVGKGANGGCIIEYEGNDDLEIYVENYLSIFNGNNKLVFTIYDNDSGSRNIEIIFDSGIYSISYIIESIKENLNQTVAANVSQTDGKLIIKMIYAWTVDAKTSSGDLLIDLGIMNSDLYANKIYKRATLVDGVYQLPFSGQITSICKLELFNNNRVFN